MGVNGEEEAVVKSKWEIGEVVLAAGAWSKKDKLGPGGCLGWWPRPENEVFKRCWGMGKPTLFFRTHPKFLKASGETCFSE